MQNQINCDARGTSGWFAADCKKFRAGEFGAAPRYWQITTLEGGVIF